MLGGALHIVGVWALATLSVKDTPRESVVVTPLNVAGPLADTWRELLVARLVEGVERSGRTTLQSDRTCDDAACWIDVARAAGADYIIRPSITVEGRDFDVGLELIDGERGIPLADSSEVCEVCAVKEVGDLLAAHAGILCEKLDALVRSPPVVVFESTPPGAVIYLDGEPIGAAPVLREVAAGPHRARAELRGYVALERHVEAVAGTQTEIGFELERPPRAQKVRLLGWALLGLGVPTAAAGITLLALDERPYRTRCTGEYVDEAGNCRLRYDTLTGGVALTSFGVASLVAGSTIVGLGRRRARPRPVRTTLVWRDSMVGLTAHGRF